MIRIIKIADIFSCSNPSSVGTHTRTETTKNVDVLVHIFYIYFFPLGIIAFLSLGIDFLIVTLVCVPTEDGLERDKTILVLRLKYI